MFDGPIMYFGLCLVGWLMLWSRPHYAFAATYAVCLFVLIVAVGAFYGGVPPVIEMAVGLGFFDQLTFWTEFLLVLAALPLVFLAVGSGVVAIRKRMSARHSASSPNTR
jgi:hypothetical protein